MGVSLRILDSPKHRCKTASTPATHKLSSLERRYIGVAQVKPFAILPLRVESAVPVPTFFSVAG
jgi:hypothetical protein